MRLRPFIVACAAALSAVVPAFGGDSAFAGGDSATPELISQGLAQQSSEASFGVVVPAGGSLDDALLVLSANRPDLRPQILSVAQSGDPKIANAAALVRRLQLESDSPGAGLSDARISVRKVDGLVTMDVSSTSAAGTASGAELLPLAASPTFQGALTLTGFNCSTRGCVPAAYLTHNAIFDLGYTTWFVNGKTSGTRAGWTSISAKAFCNAGTKASCSATVSLPAGASWALGRYSFSRSMAATRARILTTFTASWAGSPGGLSGWTPYFNCSASTTQCKFE